MGKAKHEKDPNRAAKLICSIAVLVGAIAKLLDSLKNFYLRTGLASLELSGNKATEQTGNCS